MKHREYRRLRAGSPAAILFIHGIIGTPDHFKEFLPLVPEGCSVCNMLLDGHGKGVRDFSRTSMKKWKAQVEATVSSLLESHEKLYIVAHSMGTLFAIDQAIRHPEKIQGLFLLATPLRLFIKPAMWINSLKVYSGRIRETDVQGLAAKAAYGIEDDKRLWLYLGWIPRYLELFSKIRRVRTALPALSVPCRVFLSKGDEMVALSTQKLLDRNPHIETMILKGSRHYYYHKEDLAYLLKEFSKEAEGLLRDEKNS